MQMRVKCRRYMPQNILKYMTVFSFLFHISTLDHVSVCFQLSIMQMSENVRWTAKLSSVRILLQTQTKDLQKLAVSKQQPTHLDIMTRHTVKPLESKHQSSRAMTAYSDSVSLWWKRVSAADIAGEKFIGKSRIFYNWSWTAQTYCKENDNSENHSGLFTAVDPGQSNKVTGKRLTCRQEIPFFLVKKKKCPMLAPLAKAFLRACASSVCRGSGFQQLWTLICQSCQAAANILSFLSNFVTDILWQ